jgi:DNA-directed RNA polymerase subunit N (RpoN/RPB10)
MDMRLPPLRCWSCNKPMQEAWGAFCVGAREGKDQATLLNALGLTRYCCRRMILTQPMPLKHEPPAMSASQEDAVRAPDATETPPPTDLLPSAPKRKATRKSHSTPSLA